MLYGSVIRGWGSGLTHTHMHIHIQSYTYIQTKISNTRLQLVKWWGSGLTYTHIYTHIHTHIHIHIRRMLHGSVICGWDSGLLSPCAYRKCQAKTSGGKCLYTRMYVSIHVHMHVDMWVYVQMDLYRCLCVCKQYIWSRYMHVHWYAYTEKSFSQRERLKPMLFNVTYIK